MTAANLLREHFVARAKKHSVVSTLLLAAIYAGTAQAGMLLATRSSITPVFYSAGVALFAALLLGRAALPGIALGSFVSNACLFPAVGDSRKWLIAALIGAGAALQAAAGAAIVERQGDSNDLVASPRSVVAFVLGGALLGCVVNATIGVSTLVAFSAVTPQGAPRAWFTWWIGDAAGVITATPFLLARFVPASSSTRRFEAFSLFATTLIAGAVVVGSGYPLVYLLMPCVVWGALRFGFRGATAASLLVSVIAIFAALNRQGRFRSFDLTETLLLLQVLIGVVCTTGLLVSTLVAGERRTEAARSLAHDALEARAKELESLHSELARKVSDRSHELSETLSRLARSEYQPPSSLLATGTVLGGRVRIEAFLAEGGMGAVYRAYDSVLDQPVAVKVVRPKSPEDLDALFRFFTEARAASAVASPAVVKTLAVDVADGSLFQILELVEGESLAERSRKSPHLTGAEVARVGSVIAEALAVAHHANVVHRDIKPSNVMLTAAEPGVKVLDFGISKLTIEKSTTWKTKTGVYMGTPAYMAPEQLADAARAGPPADVYSLGATMFELLTDTLPNEDTDVLATLARTGWNEELSALIAGALARSAELRPTASKLAQALHQLAEKLGAPSATAVLSATSTRAAVEAPTLREGG